MSLKVVKSLMGKLNNCHFTDVAHWMWIIKSSLQNKIRNESWLQSKDLEGKERSLNIFIIEFGYSWKSQRACQRLIWVTGVLSLRKHQRFSSGLRRHPQVCISWCAVVYIISFTNSRVLMASCQEALYAWESAFRFYNIQLSCGISVQRCWLYAT